MDDVTEFFDVWSDRSQPELRFVLPMIAPLSSIFASGTMELFTSLHGGDTLFIERGNKRVANTKHALLQGSIRL